MTAKPTSDTAPRHRRRASVLSVGLVALVMLAGCDESDDVDPDEFGAAAEDNGPATIDPDTPPATRTPDDDTETQGADVPQAGEPPSLDGLYSDDELEVARTLSDYYGWLLRHPDTDPGLVDKIFDEAEEGDPTRYEMEYARIKEYGKEPQWWWVGGHSEVVDVEVLDAQLPNSRTVRIYYHRKQPMKLVDEEGEVHETRPAGRIWEDEVWSREDGNSPWQTLDVGDSGEWEEGDL